mgnify:FL=1
MFGPFTAGVQMDTKPLQYLYSQDDSLFCMNTETFETIEVPSSVVLGPSQVSKFLTEGMVVSAQLLGDEVLSIELPKFASAVVEYADIKGQQASPTYALQWSLFVCCLWALICLNVGSRMPCSRTASRCRFPRTSSRATPSSFASKI